MNIETACAVLGIHAVKDRAETVRLAHAAFRRAALCVHPDRVAYQPALDPKSAEERYAVLAEAITVVKKVFEAPPPIARAIRPPPRSVIAKKPVCVVNIRLHPEDMTPRSEPRLFNLPYEDACNYCVRTGLYRMEGSKCLECAGAGKRQVFGARPGAPKPVCQKCLGTGNLFCELPCPQCKGTRGIRFEVCFEVPAGTALPLGMCVHEIKAAKDSFYSKIIVRVAAMLQAPSPNDSPPPSSTPETI